MSLMPKFASESPVLEGYIYIADIDSKGCIYAS